MHAFQGAAAPGASPRRGAKDSGSEGGYNRTAQHHGATFTSADVAECPHAATIAIVSQVPVEKLWDAIPAFSTRSEI